MKPREVRGPSTRLLPSVVPVVAPTPAPSPSRNPRHLPRSLLSASSDTLGGALDGALEAMHVPLKPHPYGRHLADAEQLALALAEAGIEVTQPGQVRLCLGFDCSAANRKAGSKIFSGKPLHASTAHQLGLADPNPYQLAIFFLGKALEVVGVPAGASVRCFCYNTQPPPKAEWLAPGERDVPGATAADAAGGDGPSATAATAPSQLPADGSAAQWVEPVVCVGMAGALDYYNSLPSYMFRGVRGPQGSHGLAEAVRYGGAIAKADEAAGGARTLLLLLTPAQGFDAAAAKAALISTRRLRVSVVALGVGDGPFHELGRLAAACPHNFTAVDFHEAIDGKFPDRDLALAALRTLPEQVLARELHQNSAKPPAVD